MLDKKIIEYVERAMHGDKEAFSLICRHKGRDILYICVSIMDNSKDGEDAAQEVMSYLYHKISELKTASAFPVWLYKITRNICINMKMKKYAKHETTTFEGNPVSEEIWEGRMDFLPAEYLKDEEKKKVLAGIVRELPFHCMMTVMMFYFDGLNYKEMGKVLDLDKKELDNTLRKARRLICRALEEREAAVQAVKEISAVDTLPFALLTELIGEDIYSFISDEQAEQQQQAFDQMLGLEGAQPHKGSSSRRQIPLKSAVVIMVTAGICIGFAGSSYRNFLQHQTPVSKPSGEDMIPQDISITDGEETEFDINTLEDMIGEADAAQLRAYEYEGAELEALRVFMDAIGAELVESVYRMNPHQEYSLYRLEKQTKQLMSITKHTYGEQEAEVTYLFTDTETYIPEDIAIMAYYEQWDRGEVK